MENNSIENKYSQDNIKECPFCNIILPLEEFQDHIMCHEIDQIENRNLSNNINDFGLRRNYINQPKKEKFQFLNSIKTKFETLFDNKTNINNTPNNNITNTVNRNRNISNNQSNNTINNVNNNLFNTANNNNRNERTDNSNEVTNKMKPIINKVSNFFKGIFNKDEDSDGSSGSEDGSSLNIRIRGLFSRRGRRRSNSADNIEIRSNSENENINDVFDDLIGEDLLNNDKYNIFKTDEYKQIISYIPTSTVSDVKKLSNNNNRCVICLSEFNVGEKESTLPCLHFFHSNCIEKWIIEKRWCPVCKYEISLDSLLNKNDF